MTTRLRAICLGSQRRLGGGALSRENSNTKLRVVALVPAYNEASSIGATIEAVLAQGRVPDHIVVIPNGCVDNTADVARGYPVTVLELPRLEHKKSEALNTAWSRYGQEADIVICLDADTVMPPNAVKDWEQEFIRDSQRQEPDQVWWGNPEADPIHVKQSVKQSGVRALPLGGSSSKFTMLGNDFLTRLQRAEFSRWTDTALRRGWTSVLAGTGAAISGDALRRVAARDDRDGPWTYSSQVEDFELTYRIRELGYRCQVSPTVRAYTDSMKTVKALWGQRMKWQVGTIEDLIGIGINRLTLVDWFQQLSGIFAAFARYLWLAVILALCLVGDLEFHWIWWVFLPLFFIAVQVKHALRIPHRDRADLIYAFLIVPAEAFAWLRAGWFTAAWLQAPFALLIGKRKDRWQAQYRAEAFKRSLIGRLRLLGLRFAALTVMSAIVMLSAGNLYPASGLPTVASVSKVGLAESLNKSVPSRCAGYVALTYDDGPTEFTRATSALLHRYRLHASFFLTGEQVEQNRQTVHSLAANGHQVGVHAGRLRDSTNFPLTHFRAEIGRTSKLIEDTTGHRPALFRPAYGQSSDAISKLVAKQKMSEVLWTLDTSDSSGKSVSEIDEAISSAKDGDIILMHENGDSAMKAVPLIAATLRRHNLCTGRVVADLAGRNIPHVGQSHSIKVTPS